MTRLSLTRRMGLRKRQSFLAPGAGLVAGGGVPNPPAGFVVIRSHTGIALKSSASRTGATGYFYARG